VKIQHGGFVVNDYGSFGLKLLTLVLALSLPAISQSPVKDSPQTTANTPTHCSAETDSVPASVRKQRDQHWNEAIDWLIGPMGEIVEPTGHDIDLTVNPFDVPGGVILTATVGGYRTVSSALNPYVEATLCIERVFDDWSGTAHPSAQQHVTILAKGDWASGLNTPPDPYRLELTLQPGRKYLLILSYYPVGDFYEYGASWDISDGTVRANDPITKYQAEQHQSSLEGLTMQQLGPALNRLVHPPK